MYAVVWSLSKIWMATLILLEQLRRNALKRSPTVHGVFRILSASV